MLKTTHEERMKGTNLAMNDHSGALVLQPLHCWVWCNTWNDYGCRYAKLTGRISCCHPSISSCWVQTCQRLKQSNAPTETKTVLTLIFWSAESSPEQQTNRSHPRSAHYKEKKKRHYRCCRLELSHFSCSTQALLRKQVTSSQKEGEKYSQFCRGVRCP